MYQILYVHDNKIRIVEMYFNSHATSLFTHCLDNQVKAQVRSYVDEIFVRN